MKNVNARENCLMLENLRHSGERIARARVFFLFYPVFSQQIIRGLIIVNIEDKLPVYHVDAVRLHTLLLFIRNE